MSRVTIPISLLYSTSGVYAALGREAVDGAMAAIAEVNGNAGLSFRLEPKLADPAGSAERYALLAETAIRHEGCQHIIGTITSWSRKEVLPVMERYRALLWYAFPYEGYEASDSIVYLGACPNQHLVPLFDHVLPRFGQRPFIVSSNYIWGWEISRIAREFTEASGGTVIAERFVPLGATDVDHLIAEIRETRPDFILSNLVGQSAAAFLAAYDGLRQRDQQFEAGETPVVACNLCETDLAMLTPTQRAGHITTATYFDDLPTAENRAFKARMAERFGRERRYTTPFASAYVAVSMLAQSIADAGTDAPDAIRRMVTARRFLTPIGPVEVNSRTHHAALIPHLALSDEKGHFNLFQSAPTPVEADPYLLHAPRRTITPPPLKVIK
ncbi:transporter substrate-binding protein [Rhizobium paknamense]|uniref:Branched-chain amino acid transport system substrate-binding protein n=1 Tax=Rhizobium paknamense TaxID=1206817 RepID=A0ABU0IAI6_9HYPH|nr:transporter substrate-binding protein [Rhizobium paknamense]MDQ0455239.1 branched-chain amino acid transport system substrate-binding protein [Rhizobium paknamense]